MGENNHALYRWVPRYIIEQVREKNYLFFQMAFKIQLPMIYK